MTPPEKERAIAEAYRSGRPMQAIRDEYGVTGRTIRRICRDHGVEIRRRLPITKQEARRYARMISDGVGPMEAASKLERSHSGMGNACERFGLSVREDSDPSLESYARMVLGYNDNVSNRNEGGLEVRSLGRRTVRVK